MCDLIEVLQSKGQHQPQDAVLFAAAIPSNAIHNPVEELLAVQ